MQKIIISLAQINTKLGNVQANLEKHLEWIREAQAAGANLILFPELSLTGYVLQDLTPTVARRPVADDPCFRPLLQASQGIDIVVGFVEAEKRQRFHISAAYLSQGEVLHIHRKIYLPTYGLFDEGRFFAHGERARAFNTRFGRMGILVCEDFWHASPPYLLWMDGAELLLFSSASPGRGLNQEPKMQSARWIEQINQGYANLFTVFVAHANRVGYEDGLNFWGGSTLYDPDGKQLAHAPHFQEALITAEIDMAQLHRTRSRLPLLRDERPELFLRELETSLEARRHEAWPWEKDG